MTLLNGRKNMSRLISVPNNAPFEIDHFPEVAAMTFIVISPSLMQEPGEDHAYFENLDLQL